MTTTETPAAYPAVTGLRGLTIQQPWASAIAIGPKRIENRTRVTHHRGPVVIHAGLRRDGLALPAGRHVTPAQAALLEFLAGRDVATLPTGAIVAVAELVGCHGEYGSGCHRPWGVTGRYHWELADVRPLAVPVPATGALGLWRPDTATARAVGSQLGDAPAVRA